MLLLHLQQTVGTSPLLCQLSEVAHTLQRHIVMVEIGAQREVGVGGQQMQRGQAVDGRLHLGGITLMNLGAHGCSAMRS